MQQRSVITCRRLVTAAAELFDRKGYVNATLGEITGAARVTKGALYFHFASKGELAHAVEEHGCTLLRPVGRPARRRQQLTAADPDRLHPLAGPGAARGSRAPRNFRLSRELRGGEAVGGGFTEAWMTTAWSLLDRAGAAGELRNGADRAGTADAARPRRWPASNCSLPPTCRTRNSPPGSLPCGTSLCPGLVGPSGRTDYRTTPR
uniref:BarZ n=1 Tax=Streptomyces virginiae TaxID=1961 RepID=Q9LBV6_STRVG|nr:BarZ [Streptomyces virginiae]